MREITGRIERLRQHFLTAGHSRVRAEVLDDGEEIGLVVQSGDHFYPARFPSALSDEEIIAELEGVLAGKGASRYSLVNFDPGEHGEPIPPGGGFRVG